MIKKITLIHHHKSKSTTHIHAIIQCCRYFIYLIIKILKNEKIATRFYLKKYLNLTSEIEYKDTSIDETSEYIFTMWLQEERPPIVNACISKMKTYYPNLIVITEKNISDYIDIPAFMTEKLNKGIITYTNFSDYVRCCLLSKYGGIWLDSTCYLTDKIPNNIINADFFMFRYLTFFHKDFASNIKVDFSSVSSYFLVSKKNNYIMLLLKKFMEDYWYENNFICHYFFWHSFVMLLNKYDKNTIKIFEKMPLGLSQNTQLLQFYLNKDFNEESFDYIKRLSFLHKLSYKTQNEIIEYSLYQKIIEESN